MTFTPSFPAASLAVLGVLALFAPSATAQDRRKGRFTDYPIKPYCTVCLQEKRIEGPEREIRLMEFNGKDVLDHIRSRHVVYVETEDFKLVSTIPGYKFDPGTTPRLRLELDMLRERFPRLRGNMPRLDRHQVAHLLALHMHRVKLEFWDLFQTKAWSYTGIMNRKNKHEIYLFARQRDYDRFTDRFTGVGASGGQEIILRSDDAVGFARPPPTRAGLNTWNNTVIHMWAHLLLECQIRNGYNMPSWLDAGFAHWWERRESPDTNTYCYSEARDVGIFGSGDWRQRVRRLMASGKAIPFAEFFDKKDMSSLTDLEHGLSFSLVDCVIENHKAGLRAFVNRLGEPGAVDHHAAFRAAFRQSVPGFDEAWRDWVIKTYPRR